MDEFGSLLLPFLGVILVIFLAYIGTKFISTKYAKMSCGKNIKVLERVALGQDKSLILVAVNKKAYLLGITGKGFSTVCEFAEDELLEHPDWQKKDFSSFFSEGLKKHNLFSNFPKNNKNGCKRP